MTKNILSIDIEEIFHAEYARGVQRNCPYRSEINLSAILGLLREYDTTATFFVVGEIAERFPEMIHLIGEEGHEVAFHGWSHVPLWDLDVESLEGEISRFKRVHPGCIGYRAPSFSLDNRTRWALDVMGRAGFLYDSSIFPTWTPLFGVPQAPIEPYYPSTMDVSRKGDLDTGVLEFPLAVYPLLGVKVPIAGGFWLRFWNTDMITRGINKMNERGLPAVIFAHSWELDSDTPKLDLTPFKRFITYYNLPSMTRKLKFLLKKFEFTSFSEYLHLYTDIM